MLIPRLFIFRNTLAEYSGKLDDLKLYRSVVDKTDELFMLLKTIDHADNGDVDSSL